MTVIRTSSIGVAFRRCIRPASLSSAVFVAAALAFSAHGADAAGRRGQSASSKPHTTDQVAVSVPPAFDRRGLDAPLPGAAEQLPAVLKSGDVQIYRRIMRANEATDWAEADRLIDSLGDRRLVGYMLAQRYLHPGYHAQAPELIDWLKAYADLPDAHRVAALANGGGKAAAGKKGAKNSGTSSGVPRPVAGASWSGAGDDDVSWRDQPYRGNGKSGPLELKIRKALKAGDPAAAQRELMRPEATGHLDAAAFDQLRADIAIHYLINGAADQAFQLASPALRSVRQAPAGAWIAGLAAWKLNKKAEARGYFEAVAKSPAASAWTASAAAYWAARAHLVTQRPQEYVAWMSRASEAPYSFYGLLARRALGQELAFDWSLPPLGAQELARLQDYPQALRAIALIQIGDRAHAEDELRRAAARVPGNLLPPLLTIAERGGMPGLSMRLAARIGQTQNVRYDAGHFPVPPWVPQGGFSLNRALLFALARLESNFDPAARSASGASGLMQLMPGTARMLTGDRKVAARDDRLMDPSNSLGLGQKLVESLLNHDRVRGNLTALAVAYNGGEGNLARWQGRQAPDSMDDDPLLFIESLPSPETRLFVKRILSNFWMYQLRFGQPVESLDAVAQGEPPVYTKPDVGSVEVAERYGRN